jgi:cysteine desulfurase
MRVYFDNAATTPLDPIVIDTMTKVLAENYGNPSSIHAEGRSARTLIEAARKTVASCINASIGEIFFTSGGTEANNMAIKCAVRDLGVRRIITSSIEHHCVLHTSDALKTQQKIKVEHVKIDEKGKINLQDLEKRLKKGTSKTLVSLMHGNNEIGTLNDLQQISALCIANGALFHSDTVQTIGHFPIDVAKLKIDFLSGAAHKFHGPKGGGFIYINHKNVIKPFIDGGAQERNMRGGTENVAGIAGLAKALELATHEMAARKQKIEAVRTYFAQQLKENFNDIQFNGDFEGNALYTVLSVSFPPSSKSDLLLMILDISGVSASGGSACSSGTEGGSHVLNALNPHSERKTIRFSFSHHNTTQEVDYVIEQLKKAV